MYHIVEPVNVPNYPKEWSGTTKWYFLGGRWKTWLSIDSMSWLICAWINTAGTKHCSYWLGSNKAVQVYFLLALLAFVSGCFLFFSAIHMMSNAGQIHIMSWWHIVYIWNGLVRIKTNSEIEQGMHSFSLVKECLLLTLSLQMYHSFWR